MSPTGTCEGDIHMQSDSRMPVDEYAQVVTIVLGEPPFGTIDNVNFCSEC